MIIKYGELGFLEDKVIPRILVEPNEELGEDCWLYQQGNKTSYAQVAWRGKNVQLHRLMYEIMVEDIPTDRILANLCDHLNCVNPTHWQLTRKGAMSKNRMDNFTLDAINADVETFMRRIVAEQSRQAGVDDLGMFLGKKSA